MHYRLIATLPLRSTGDVLAEAFRYVLEYDSFLLRLKEHWRVIPGGIAIHDSFNNQDIPFGRKAGTREWDMDDHRFFTNDYGSYRLLDNPSVDVLDDILETLNDRYGADCFAVRKNDSGYGFYRCEPSSERIEDADELYRRLRAEGRSKGHAQWIVGSRLMDGRGVAKNHAEAERWLLLAWNNAFPGTARTEAFLLGRFWNTLLESRFEERPRLRALLKDAVIEAGERKGSITVPAANDAKAQWLQGRLDELPEALIALSGGRFMEISVRVEKTA